MKNQALLNHQIVSADGESLCNLYPVAITADESNVHPTDKGHAESLHYRVQRQARKSTLTEAWLISQQMKPENLYRQQQVHDRDIMRLEHQVCLLRGDMLWLKVAVVILVFTCGGLMACLI